jgi:hypothetical protein
MEVIDDCLVLFPDIFPITESDLTRFLNIQKKKTVNLTKQKS